MNPLSPITANQQRDLLHCLQQAFHVDLSTWQRLNLNNVPLGYLNTQWQQQLQADIPELLSIHDDGYHILTHDWLHCADVLQNLGREWYDLGLFTGWRNEQFDVCDLSGTPLFALERSLFRPLGMVSQAVHLNGFVVENGVTQMWIGKRSPFKAVDPDKLDNLVGGGVATGESLQEACIREGFEEAGLGIQLTGNQPPPRCIHSQRIVSRGLHHEHLFVYDLSIPTGWTPENQDGEVASFQLMDIPSIVDAMLTGRFMNDAMLVTLDGLMQHGFITRQSELGSWLLAQRC